MRDDALSLLPLLLQQVSDQRQEIEMLKNVISVIPGHLFWKDAQDRCLGCNNNAASVLGFNSPEEMIGLHVNSLLHAISPNIPLSEFIQTDREVIEKGVEKTYEEVGFDAMHHPATYLTRKAPLYDAQKKIQGIIGISFDISERKKIEQELIDAKQRAETANTIKLEFIANMSHDIKTPLAGILGVAELLTHQLQKGEALHLAQMLLFSSRQLFNFVDHCLELSNIEHSELFVKTECFCMKTLVDELQALFQPLLSTKSLQFELSLDPLVPEYMVGQVWGLYRILLNLVNNAIKFTAEGFVSIQVTAPQVTHEEAVVQITVTDTGIGIAKQDQQVIFDRFTRLSPSYKGLHEGSGMGLYIVQKLVQQMGGKIILHSQEGNGSQFIVTLPFKILYLTDGSELRSLSHTPEMPCALPRIEKKEPVSIEAPLMHVLLVEDNHIAQNITCALLASLRCQVELVGTGEQALNLFQPGKYDLVLLDIGLPNMQGDMVAKKIREREQSTLFTVPIIALTAHVSDNARHHYKACGINAVYNKPLLRDQVQALIHEVQQQAKPSP